MTIPKKFTLSAETFAYYFAAFNGLAYYAVIFMFSGVLHFEKGFIRFFTSLLCLLIATLLFQIAQKQGGGVISIRRPWPLAVKTLGVYFLWSLASFLWSNPGSFNTQGFSTASFYFAQWVNYLIEFLTVALICAICPIERVMKKYLQGLRVGGLVLAGIYLLSWLFIGKAGRLSAFGHGVDVIHPNNLALKLAVSILCSIHLYFWQDVKTRHGLLKFALFAVPMLFALMLTIGKTVLVGFFIAVLVYLIQMPHQRRTIFTILLPILLVTSLSIPLITDYLYKYWQSGNLLTLSGRTELWVISLKEALNHPFTGHGIASPLPTLSWNARQSGQSGTAHNEYLNAFYEMGIIGLIIVLLIYFLFFYSAVHARRRANFKFHAIFCMSIFIIMLIFSFTASFPVGFAMPMTFQLLLHCWMSGAWLASENSIRKNCFRSVQRDFPDLQDNQTTVSQPC